MKPGHLCLSCLLLWISLFKLVPILNFSPQEPEVIDLARFLTGSGACVEGAGSDTLYIKGKNQLHGSECIVPPDRIEAGTFMLAAAITRSSISMSPVIPSHVACLIDKLLAAGCKITCAHDTLEVWNFLLLVALWLFCFLIKVLLLINTLGFSGSWWCWSQFARLWC